MTREDALTPARDRLARSTATRNPQVGVPFFDAATGSLGQGLSVAAGLGAAAQMDKLDRNIYCIIGDGESREGQIWEAMDFIADHALTNVVPIFNCNELAQSDWVSPQQSCRDAGEEAEAYGFIVRIDRRPRPRADREGVQRAERRQERQPPAGDRRADGQGLGRAAEQGMGKHGTPVKKDKLQDDLRGAGQDREGPRRRRLQGRRRAEDHAAAEGRKPTSPSDEADQDRAVRRRPGDGRARQGPRRRQADRAAQGVRRRARRARRRPTSASSASTPT